MLPALAGVRVPVLQTSANLSGGPDPRRLPTSQSRSGTARTWCLDGGELPGMPSTVVDLSGYEEDGEWKVLREGAVPPRSAWRLLG